MARLTLAVALVVALLSSQHSRAQQLSYSSGRHVAPAFEGWEKNTDGSFSLLFGYMNQNWDEEIDVPVGPDNSFSPVAVDQGQPTHFQPRRNRFVFKVRVPGDFGTKELVWTLTSQGKTVRAYGSLRPDYFLEPVTLISEKGGIGGGGGGPEVRANAAPVLKIEGGATRSVGVGRPLLLTLVATDDGVPKPKPAQSQSAPVKRSPGEYDPPANVTVNSAVGVRVSCYRYRGAGAVSFDPPQIKTWEDTREGANSPWAPRWTPPLLPVDGRIAVEATFSQPGSYVLRCLADDGGLWDDQDVTVAVAP